MVSGILESIFTLVQRLGIVPSLLSPALLNAPQLGWKSDILSKTFPDSHLELFLYTQFNVCP